MLAPNRLAYWPQPMMSAPQLSPAGVPMNMLAAADFAPDSLVAQMLAQQRAAAARAQKVPPKVPPRPTGVETADQVLKRRMREQGLE